MEIEENLSFSSQRNTSQIASTFFPNFPKPASKVTLLQDLGAQNKIEIDAKYTFLSFQIISRSLRHSALQVSESRIPQKTEGIQQNVRSQSLYNIIERKTAESAQQLQLKTAQIAPKQPIRRKNRKREREAGYTLIDIPSMLFLRNIFHVYGDISITSDFQFLLGSAVIWGSIGTECMRCGRVTQKGSLTEIEMDFIEIPSISLEVVMSRISPLCDSPIQSIFYEGLSDLSEFLSQKKKVKGLEFKLADESTINSYDNFCREVYERIEILSQSQSLFGYVFGRFDCFTGKVNVKHLGYSRELLNLLCLNSEILEQVYLRNKQINLFFDEKQLQELSLFYMDCRVKKQHSIKTRMHITTIDGYKLCVSQSMEKIAEVLDEGSDSCYFQAISKFDIDIHDLQGLIEYRNSLANSQGMSFDRLIQAELSKLLEDVEYSVQSQLFMEKYYRQSVIELAQIMQQKLQNSLKNEEIIRCGYRII